MPEQLTESKLFPFPEDDPDWPDHTGVIFPEKGYFSSAGHCLNGPENYFSYPAVMLPDRSPKQAPVPFDVSERATIYGRLEFLASQRGYNRDLQGQLKVMRKLVINELMFPCWMKTIFFGDSLLQRKMPFTIQLFPVAQALKEFLREHKGYNKFSWRPQLLEFFYKVRAEMEKHTPVSSPATSTHPIPSKALLLDFATTVAVKAPRFSTRACQQLVLKTEDKKTQPKMFSGPPAGKHGGKNIAKNRPY